MPNCEKTRIESCLAAYPRFLVKQERIAAEPAQSRWREISLAIAPISHSFSEFRGLAPVAMNKRLYEQSVKCQEAFREVGRIMSFIAIVAVFFVKKQNRPPIRNRKCGRAGQKLEHRFLPRLLLQVMKGVHNRSLESISILNVLSSRDTLHTHAILFCRHAPWGLALQ